MPETGPSNDGPSAHGVGPIAPEILERIEGDVSILDEHRTDLLEEFCEAVCDEE